MWVCEPCLRDTDTASILPVSYGRCEDCGKSWPCHDVTKREPRASLPMPRAFRCRDCGRPLTTTTERKLRVDPYLDELKNVQQKGRWCKKCYEEMLREI